VDQRRDSDVLWAIRDGTAAQRSAAFGTIGYLKAIPAPLASWLLTRLSNEILSAPGSQEVLSLGAEAARLPMSVGARYVYRRCRSLRKIIPPKVGKVLCGFDNTGWISAGILMFYGWGFQAWLSRGLKISSDVRTFMMSSPAGRVSLLVTTLSLLGTLLFGFVILFVVGVRDIGGNAVSARMWPALKGRPYLCIMLASPLTNLGTTFVSSAKVKIGLFGGAMARYVVTILASVFSAVFTVAIFLLPIVVGSVAAAKVLVKRRRRRRLEHLCRNFGESGIDQEAVVLQARTLAELNTWLIHQRWLICPDDRGALQLAKVLLIGKDSPDLLPDSPLASYMRKMKGKVGIATILTRIEGYLA